MLYVATRDKYSAYTATESNYAAIGMMEREKVVIDLDECLPELLAKHVPTIIMPRT